MKIISGHVGSDAGYYVFDTETGKWTHVGGWQPEAFAEVRHALGIIAATPRLKTPGLADATAKVMAEFVQKELGQHINLTEGTVIVIQAGG